MLIGEQAAVLKEGLRVTVPVCSRLPVWADEPLKYGEWLIPPKVSHFPLVPFGSGPCRHSPSRIIFFPPCTPEKKKI